MLYTAFRSTCPDTTMNFLLTTDDSNWDTALKAVKLQLKQFCLSTNWASRGHKGVEGCTENFVILCFWV